IFLTLYSAYAWRGFQTDNALMWGGIFMAVIICTGFFPWFIYPLKCIEVTEKEILVRFLITRRFVRLPFSAVRKFRVSRGKRQFGAMLLTGSTELRNILKNGDELHFDENQFSNFNEIRQAMYAGWKSVNNFEARQTNQHRQQGWSFRGIPFK